MRYLYTFPHMGRYKVFGPYENVEEAKGAFQTRYGYWPADPIEEMPYDSPPQ